MYEIYVNDTIPFQLATEIYVPAFDFPIQFTQNVKVSEGGYVAFFDISINKTVTAYIDDSTSDQSDRKIVCKELNFSPRQISSELLWTSSDNEIISPDKSSTYAELGYDIISFTPKKEGVAIITATAEVNPNIAKSFIVNVVKMPEIEVKLTQNHYHIYTESTPIYAYVENLPQYATIEWYTDEQYAKYIRIADKISKNIASKRLVGITLVAVSGNLIPYQASVSIP